MLKKMIKMGTVLFLLFELLYWNSNSTVLKMQQDSFGKQVYRFAIPVEKEEFLNQYQDIVLDEEEGSLLVLTDSEVIQEIIEKYHITVEN